MILNKKGNTLLEMVVGMSIIMIFLMTATIILSGASASYIKATYKSKANGVVETITDDIKAYITYGEKIKVYRDIKSTDTLIAGADVSFLEENTKLFSDGSYIPPEGSSMPNGSVIFTVPNEYYANTIDLGFKKIYVAKSNGHDYIHGLSYGIDFYEKLELDFQIREILVNSTTIAGAKERVFVINILGSSLNKEINLNKTAAVTGVNNMIK